MEPVAQPPRPQQPFCIGLTGGIGSGKSTVARILVDLGAALVDTDAIARSLTAAGGTAMPALIEAFGPAIAGADGALLREAMRERAFADPAARARLEEILHPLIGNEAMRQAQVAQQRGCVAIVFDVPLLTESRHWRERVDRVLVVDCEEATQVARVLQRPGWSAEAAHRVIASQAARAARLAIADAVIYNDGITLDRLTLAVQSLWARWLQRV